MSYDSSYFGQGNTTYVVGPESNIKTAALFFKYVVPISPAGGHRQELAPPYMSENAHNVGDRFDHWGMEDALLGALYELGYTDAIRNEEFIIAYDGHPLWGYYQVNKGYEDQIGFIILELIQKNAVISIPEHSLFGSSLNREKKRPIRDVIFSFTDGCIEHPIFGCDLLGGTDAGVNSVLVTLTNIPWIDLSNTEWENIFDFRQDADSLQKFRDFRSFIANSYDKKSPSYIEDDFLKRLDSFERARKKHGFDAQQTTLKSVVNSKYILGGGLSGLLAMNFGNADAAGIVGSATMLGGVCIEFANVLIDLRAANFNLKHQIQGNELAYAIAARDQLTGKRSLLSRIFGRRRDN